MIRRWDFDPATLRATEYRAGTDQPAVLLGYQYDDSGNVTRIEDSLNSGQYECYSYDTSNRLSDAFTGTSACTAYSSAGSAPYDHDYAYDNLHNMLSFDGPTYSYGSGNEAGAGDAGPHAVVGIGGTIGFSYDDNGNRISRTEDAVTTGYSYNAENRLESVDLASADDVSFVYDADGRRVSRTAGDYSTVYVAGLVEIDRDASTVTETRTLYGFAGTAVVVRTHEQAATTFLFQNHLGSTVAGYDDTNNTAIKQYYYPYGAERAAVGTLPVDQRYTGQTSDNTGADSGDTGLVYYQARYYDPQTGAFVAADSIVPTTGLSVGLNRYAYVSGNPANLSDPTGHMPILRPCIDGSLCRGATSPAAPRASTAAPQALTGVGGTAGVGGGAGGWGPAEDDETFFLILSSGGHAADAAAEALFEEVWLYGYRVEFVHWRIRLPGYSDDVIAIALRPVGSSSVTVWGREAPAALRGLPGGAARGALRAFGRAAMWFDIAMSGLEVWQALGEGDIGGAVDTAGEGAFRIGGGYLGAAAVLAVCTLSGPVCVGFAAAGGAAGSEAAKAVWDFVAHQVPEWITEGFASMAHPRFGG